MKRRLYNTLIKNTLPPCFFLALLCGFLASVSCLVHQSGIATAQEQKKGYPFHEALRLQDLDAAQRLLAKNGEELFTKTDGFGMLALHAAASSGSLESVRFLIEQGADPNYIPAEGYSSKILGRSPLHSAVETGNAEIISLLLQKGANILAVDNSGALPLHLAIQYGRKEIARQLIQMMGERSHTRDQNGTTPLHIAARQGHDDLVANLLFVENKGLRQRVEKLLAFQNPNSTSKAESTLSHLIDIKNNFGLSPLHYAALGGHSKVTELLLERGANVNTFNAQGLTPLFLASRNGHESVVELLSSQKETNLESGDDEAHTPLCIAIANGHLRIFSRLLRRGANPHAKDKNGMIPLHIASKRGNIDAVKSLLKTLDRGNINERDNIGNTPLLYAAGTGKEELVALLLEAGGDLSARNKKGETPFSLAQRLGHAPLLPLLR